LPGDAHGVLAFFDKAGLVEYQDATGIAHLVGDDLMIGPPQVLLIPGDLTEKPLQPADTPSRDPKGYRLDGLPFQRT
jgi:hypothetical protein